MALKSFDRDFIEMTPGRWDELNAMFEERNRLIQRYETELGVDRVAQIRLEEGIANDEGRVTATAAAASTSGLASFASATPSQNEPSAGPSQKKRRKRKGNVDPAISGLGGTATTGASLLNPAAEDPPLSPTPKGKRKMGPSPSTSTSTPGPGPQSKKLKSSTPPSPPQTTTSENDNGIIPATPTTENMEPGSVSAVTTDDNVDSRSLPERESDGGSIIGQSTEAVAETSPPEPNGREVATGDPPSAQQQVDNGGSVVNDNNDDPSQLPVIENAHHPHRRMPPETSFNCWCGYSGHDFDDLEYHLMCSISTKLIHCPGEDCGLSLPSQDVETMIEHCLEAHLMDISLDRQCAMCGAYFKSLQEMRMHQWNECPLRAMLEELMKTTD